MQERGKSSGRLRGTGASTRRVAWPGDTQRGRTDEHDADQGGEDLGEERSGVGPGKEAVHRRDDEQGKLA